VENPAVAELGMGREQRLHDQLFCPARVKAHRPDHHVLIDRHRRVASEEEVGQRRQRVAELVESARQWTRLLLLSFDEKLHDCRWWQFAQLGAEWLERDDIERLTNDELAHLAVLEHLGEEIAYVQNL